MTIVATAYACLALGFCLGFVTCGLMGMNRDKPRCPLTRDEEAREVLDRG